MRELRAICNGLVLLQIETAAGQKIVMLTVSETNADVAQPLNAGVRGEVLKGVGSKCCRNPA